MFDTSSERAHKRNPKTGYRSLYPLTSSGTVCKHHWGTSGSIGRRAAFILNLFFPIRLTYLQTYMKNYLRFELHKENRRAAAIFDVVAANFDGVNFHHHCGIRLLYGPGPRSVVR